MVPYISNPVTKESTYVDVPAGEMITIYLDEEAEGSKTISIRKKSFREEDLPLEVAIINGYRDVLDVGTDAGYDKDSLSELMASTKETMEDVLTKADVKGATSLDKMSIAQAVSESIASSAGEMTSSDLSPSEVRDVVEAAGTLFKNAVELADNIESAVAAVKNM